MTKDQVIIVLAVRRSCPDCPCCEGDCPGCPCPGGNGPGGKPGCPFGLFGLNGIPPDCGGRSTLERTFKWRAGRKC